MCYTISINLTREEIQKRYNANLNPDLPFRKSQHINAFTFPDCPVICADDPKSIRLYTWGLIPVWAYDDKYANEIRKKTFNAKAEKVAEKPSFRHLIKFRKCLVLTTGFYEWQARGNEKQPYFIQVKNIESFALAGLYDIWTSRDTGEVMHTFTIITTAANPLMEKIHNTKKRMPVILPVQDETTWIDPSLPVEKSLSLLKPFDEERMVAEEVDKELFKTKIKGDQCSPF